MMLSERQMDRLKKARRSNPTLNTVLTSVEMGGMDFEEALIVCIEAASGDHMVRCEGCGLSYGLFPLDVTVPDDQWRQISGRDDGGGILCASCIVARGARLPGVTVAKLVFGYCPTASTQNAEPLSAVGLPAGGEILPEKHVGHLRRIGGDA